MIRSPSKQALAEASSKTAIHRSKPSLPARKVLGSDLTLLGSVLDWGCGRGKDVAAYREGGLYAFGYDPAFIPKLPVKKYDLITCTYVLNTLPPSRRKGCIQDALRFIKPNGYLFVTARSRQDIERGATRSWRKTLDGYITSRGTFQHGFDQTELDNLVLSVAGTSLVNEPCEFEFEGIALEMAPFKISGAVASLSRFINPSSRLGSPINSYHEMV